MKVSCSHTYNIPSPSHSSYFDRPDNIWWRVGLQKITLLVMQSAPPLSTRLDRPKYLLQHPTVEHALLLSSLNVTVQASHPHRRQGKIQLNVRNTKNIYPRTGLICAEFLSKVWFWISHTLTWFPAWSATINQTFRVLNLSSQNACICEGERSETRETENWGHSFLFPSSEHKWTHTNHVLRQEFSKLRWHSPFAFTCDRTKTLTPIGQTKHFSFAI